MMPPNRGPARGARIPGAKLDMRSARRLLSYLGGRHKAALAVVLVCILFSAVAGVAGSLFLEILIDDYISPLLAVANPSFGGLLRAILTMAALYLAGVLSTYLYNRLMVVVAQGVLKEILSLIHISAGRGGVPYGRGCTKVLRSHGGSLPSDSYGGMVIPSAA